MTKRLNYQLKKLVRKLKPYKPAKIILFGSYAWGHPSRSSDVDLFIIKSSRKLRHHRIADAEQLLVSAPFALDVLVYTPAEVEKRLQLGDFFINRIINEGKVLYAAKA